VAILHGHHVGDVLHHQCARLEKSDHVDEFLIKQVARVAEVARTDLAEPLARRSTVDEVDLLGHEFIKRRHARLRIL
jgi:hypothetical protein